MNHVHTGHPVSVRLESELFDRLDRNVALRRLAGENVKRTDVIREALDAYLEGFDTSLITEQLRETLNS